MNIICSFGMACSLLTTNINNESRQFLWEAGSSVSDVTRILESIQGGQKEATEALLPIVYDELRRLAASQMARESANHTLSATALVHEAYLKLVGSESTRPWEGRCHFFGAAAQAMRRILIDHARRKGRLCHGGALQRNELDDEALANNGSSDEILAVHESLSRLAEVSPQKAKLVELRYFAGLSSHEAAEVLGISRATADRYWAFARAWLLRDISQ